MIPIVAYDSHKRTRQGVGDLWKEIGQMSGKMIKINTVKAWSNEDES